MVGIVIEMSSMNETFRSMKLVLNWKLELFRVQLGYVWIQISALWTHCFTVLTHFASPADSLPYAEVDEYPCDGERDS